MIPQNIQLMDKHNQLDFFLTLLKDLSVFVSLWNKLTLIVSFVSACSDVTAATHTKMPPHPPKIFQIDKLPLFLVKRHFSCSASF